MTKQQKIQWLEHFEKEWENITLHPKLTLEQCVAQRKKMEAQLTSFCEKHTLPVISADDLILHIKYPKKK